MVNSMNDHYKSGSYYILLCYLSRQPQIVTIQLIIYPATLYPDREQYPLYLSLRSTIVDVDIMKSGAGGGSLHFHKSLTNNCFLCTKILWLGPVWVTVACHTDTCGKIYFLTQKNITIKIASKVKRNI